MSIAVMDRQNRVMKAMLCLSLLIHIIIMIRVADIYKKEAVSYIELSLEADEAPKGRSIPRPRRRIAVPETETVKRVRSAARVQKTDFKQIQRAVSNTGESIGIPQIPAIEGSGGLYSGGGALYNSAQDYFEMVRLRIERHKKFPPQAKKMRKEGGVTVRFVITGDGMVSSLQIIKKSRHRILNTAALDAVKDSAPFPAPPRNLFKKKLHVEIRIVFELM